MKNDYDKHRQIYASMVNYLDTGVGKIVDTLTESKMVRFHFFLTHHCWHILLLSLPVLSNCGTVGGHHLVLPVG